ncbi:MAG TPA: alpha-amylase family glycosyl hydrolase, partial [Candidatus Sumerlaeota bacterium]|nr:alpha-amylase family glycosyl hydrolase [Candidatus Sumerlaeota bacterium]
MMRRVLFALFLVAGLLSGVSIHGELPPEFVPFPFSAETIPTLRANSGETVTLDARDFIHGSGASELKRVYSADFSTSVTAASLPEDPCEIRVSFSPDMQGVHIVPLVFEWTEARRSRMDVAVFLHKKFEADFTYRQGKAVKSVSVAGTFNGWNMARNPLNDDDGDGVWTARVAMEPGEHKYKFVVDGEWIPDPSNPLQESGGYSNSILKAGEAFNDPIPRLIPLKSRKSGAFMEYSFLYLDASGKHPAGRERHVLIGNEEVVLETMQEDNTIMFRVPVEAAREKPVRVFVRSHGVLWAEEACIIEAKQSGNRPYDWRDAAIYFVFTDRFHNGDTSNDAPVKDERLAPRADWHGGDFAGIEQKIREGYFTKLGVNTLWLSPANRNAGGAWRDSLPPNRYFTGYHGYWPVAPRETEPHFGSMDDLKRLINTAHKSGIRVILDFVTNHTHMDHPYFQEHRDWFGTLDLPDGRKNIRLFDEHPFTTWFDTFLPSFDYPASPEARAQTIADGLWWIEETQADGLRHDATKHIPLVFWKELCRELRERIEIPRGIKLYQVGETISDRETIMRFVGPGLLT